MNNILIGDAVAADPPAITAILNEAIVNTTTVSYDDPRTFGWMDAWFAIDRAKGLISLSVAMAVNIQYKKHMITIRDNTLTSIARRIRLERDVRGWSLAELAERSGVSKAAISKIEREEMSPTAVILVRLAGAFDLTLAGLLLRAEGEKERLIRADDQQTWRDPETGYVRRQVFMRPDHPVEVARIELPAGQRVAMPTSAYAHIRQVVWVLAGQLVILEGGERHELEVGDCLGFGPPSEVTFANEGSVSCTYAVVLARS